MKVLKGFYPLCKLARVRKGTHFHHCGLSG